MMTLFFELWPNFKSASNDPKWPSSWYVEGQKYQDACYIHPLGPNFCPFLCTMNHFWVTGQFLEKCTEWPQMPWHGQGKKYQHACYIHPWRPNFRPLRSMMSRFWVTAQFLEKCTKWPQMTLTCSRSKTPTCMLHAPLGPKFSFVSLYDEPFSRKMKLFEFSIGYNVKILLLVTLNKLKISKIKKDILLGPPSRVCSKSLVAQTLKL